MSIFQDCFQKFLKQLLWHSDKKFLRKSPTSQNSVIPSPFFDIAIKNILGKFHWTFFLIFLCKIPSAIALLSRHFFCFFFQNISSNGFGNFFAIFWVYSLQIAVISLEISPVIFLLILLKISSLPPPIFLQVFVQYFFKPAMTTCQQLFVLFSNYFGNLMKKNFQSLKFSMGISLAIWQYMKFFQRFLWKLSINFSEIFSEHFLRNLFITL